MCSTLGMALMMYKDLAHLSEADSVEEETPPHEDQSHTESNEYRSQSLLVSSGKEESSSQTEILTQTRNENSKSKEEDITSSSAVASTVPQTDTHPFIQENTHA